MAFRVRFYRVYIQSYWSVNFEHGLYVHPVFPAEFVGVTSEYEMSSACLGYFSICRHQTESKTYSHLNSNYLNVGTRGSYTGEWQLTFGTCVPTFQKTCCPSHTSDGAGSRFVRNVGTYVETYGSSHTGRLISASRQFAYVAQISNYPTFQDPA